MIRDLHGVFKYLGYLPTDKYLDIPNLGEPFCYKSEGLAKRLGLSNLYIAFSGYWPEKGAHLVTRTFKELEAQVVMANAEGTLIVPSAGNAANGFNLIAHLMGVKVVLVVPETGLDKLVLPFETNPIVIAVKGDYADAIELAGQMSKETGLQLSPDATSRLRQIGGGGVVMLNAVLHPEQGTGELYHHYFQAVGSGTGAIGAWEAAMTTKIHIAQNAPFTPLVDFVQSDGKDMTIGRFTSHATETITADVLANRKPPFMKVLDTIRESGGMAWRVSNYAVFHAARAFREMEGVDIGPAAAVAVDALKQAVETGVVEKDERVLLHITGGGRELQYSESRVYQAEPTVMVLPEEVSKAYDAITAVI